MVLSSSLLSSSLPLQQRVVPFPVFYFLPYEHVHLCNELSTLLWTHRSYCLVTLTVDPSSVLCCNRPSSSRQTSNRVCVRAYVHWLVTSLCLFLHVYFSMMIHQQERTGGECVRACVRQTGSEGRTREREKERQRNHTHQNE